ncbi:flagellar hook-length control protein FliK [Shewanella gelidii]|uniref:Flagellar hook-length control protein-like C-terminal domain-containing protein n=1 Tax=Shewanella gelidii TaxID=1642821 RepID=A0A917JHC0_9GAMM|nr:flagellar hook-length control protein FliK [Shewanella gelidii]MCL1096460.1 flagellar hook-length control protein FliK [Shewanella gelidii]GGI67506.1 hypothetical protein GCM10009332_00890 [Shewanella gelidii]
MSQLTNTLMGITTETNLSKSSADLQVSDSEVFSAEFSKAKQNYSSTLATSSVAADVESHTNETPKTSQQQAQQSSAKMVFEQIAMSEQIDKSQKSAADSGEDLPLEDKGAKKVTIADLKSQSLLVSEPVTPALKPSKEKETTPLQPGNVEQHPGKPTKYILPIEDSIEQFEAVTPLKGDVSITDKASSIVAGVDVAKDVSKSESKIVDSQKLDMQRANQSTNTNAGTQESKHIFTERFVNGTQDEPELVEQSRYNKDRYFALENESRQKGSTVNSAANQFATQQEKSKLNIDSSTKTTGAENTQIVDKASHEGKAVISEDAAENKPVVSKEVTESKSGSSLKFTELNVELAESKHVTQTDKKDHSSARAQIQVEPQTLAVDKIVKPTESTNLESKVTVKFEPAKVEVPPQFSKAEPNNAQADFKSPTLLSDADTVSMSTAGKTSELVHQAQMQVNSAMKPEQAKQNLAAEPVQSEISKQLNLMLKGSAEDAIKSSQPIENALSAALKGSERSLTAPPNGTIISAAEVLGKEPQKNIENLELAKAQLEIGKKADLIPKIQTDAKSLLAASQEAMQLAHSAKGLGLEVSGVDKAFELELDNRLQSVGHSLQSSAQVRQDVQQIQVSLRQPSEASLSMAQVIQRFAPVMQKQLLGLVNRGVQHAEIRLDPAELGSMVVKIQVQGDQTQVQFQASQAQTRDVLEQAMPRLREMLQQHGMELADGQVSQEQNHGQSRHEEETQIGYSAEEQLEISAEELVLSTNQATSYETGIDYYA